MTCVLSTQARSFAMSFKLHDDEDDDDFFGVRQCRAQNVAAASSSNSGSQALASSSSSGSKALRDLNGDVITNKSFHKEKSDSSWGTLQSSLCSGDEVLTIYRYIQKAWPHLKPSFIHVMVQARPNKVVLVVLQSLIGAGGSK